MELYQTKKLLQKKPSTKQKDSQPNGRRYLLQQGVNIQNMHLAKLKHQTRSALQQVREYSVQIFQLADTYCCFAEPTGASPAHVQI